MGAPEKIKPFQYRKGQSGNPNGRPPIPAELRGIMSLTQGEVTKLVSKYARMTREELQSALQNSSTPMIEITIASIFAQSAKNGDYTRLSFLLDRAIGKVPVCEVDDESQNDLKLLTTQELIELAKQKIPELEKAG